jgi:hypothetical protein
MSDETKRRLNGRPPRVGGLGIVLAAGRPTVPGTVSRSARALRSCTYERDARPNRGDC